MRLFTAASALALLIAGSAVADVGGGVFPHTIKMSSNGTCYAPTDLGYADITPTSAFATMADCTNSGGWNRAQGVPSRKTGTNPGPMGGKMDAVAGARPDVLIVPETFLWHNNRAAQAAVLRRERAALDVLHGVSPAERALGPNPDPASYPEKTFIPAVPLATGGFHFPQSVILHPTAPAFGGYNTPYNALTARPAAPPVATPGAYGTGGAVQVQPWIGGAPAPRPAPPGSIPPNSAGVLGDAPLATQAALDALALQMEAQGVMPPGYAPGTAPDVNDMLSAQGIDPSAFPGFDGDPAMMGLGTPGASFTVSP